LKISAFSHQLLVEQRRRDRTWKIIQKTYDFFDEKQSSTLNILNIIEEANVDNNTTNETQYDHNQRVMMKLFIIISS
jgi:hypothetical protein